MIKVYAVIAAYICVGFLTYGTLYNQRCHIKLNPTSIDEYLANQRLDSCSDRMSIAGAGWPITILYLGPVTWMSNLAIRITK